MFLNRSTGRKILATTTAVVAFAMLYEVTMLDSRYAARQADQELTAAPAPGARLRSRPPATARGRRPRPG